jgi:hypothetical protein
LSGLDEQYIDFPVCTNCKRFTYWYTAQTNPEVEDIIGLCFNSNDFLSRGGASLRKVNDSSYYNKEDLDSILAVKCNACRREASPELLAVIIKLGKKFFHTRAKDVWTR